MGPLAMFAEFDEIRYRSSLARDAPADVLNARTRSEEIAAVRQHEMFARGFVLYMREGKAPSPALSDAFAKYRVWLMAIYPTAESLDVTLPPEMRAVFDRLHA